MSNSLQPLGLQHARLPCPSPTPGAYSNTCPSSQWCHPTISSSVIPFSSHLQSFPASGSFPMSQLFPSGGQSIGASASASFLPINIQDWFPSGWTGWTSLRSKGLSRVFSNTTVQTHQFFGSQLSLISLLSIENYDFFLHGMLFHLLHLWYFAVAPVSTGWERRVRCVCVCVCVRARACAHVCMFVYSSTINRTKCTSSVRSHVSADMPASEQASGARSIINQSCSSSIWLNPKMFKFHEMNWSQFQNCVPTTDLSCSCAFWPKELAGA